MIRADGSHLRTTRDAWHHRVATHAEGLLRPLVRWVSRGGRSCRERASDDLRSQRGFTLIEMANVIMIVSVLTIICLPTVSDSHKSVKRTSCAERQRKIFEAAILYGAENIVPNGNVNVSVLIPYYVKRDVAECPESVTRDYDDYTIVFAGGAPVDVICDIEGEEHPWAPH